MLICWWDFLRWIPFFLQCLQNSVKLNWKWEGSGIQYCGSIFQTSSCRSALVGSELFCKLQSHHITLCHFHSSIQYTKLKHFVKCLSCMCTCTCCCMHYYVYTGCSLPELQNLWKLLETLSKSCHLKCTSSCDVNYNLQSHLVFCFNSEKGTQATFSQILKGVLNLKSGGTEIYRWTEKDNLKNWQD